MDGLALLCNLHADGPRCLRRLRRTGITTIQELVDTELSVLAGLLDANRQAAMRFKEEARGLQVRLEDPPLDRRFEGEDEPIPEGVEPLHSPSHAAPTTPLQRSDGPPMKSPERSPDDSDVMRFASTLQIRKGEVEGLDGRTCELLVQEGIRTYGALMELVGLSLARRLGMSYPKLLDMGYRTRRMVRERVVLVEHEVPDADRLTEGCRPGAALDANAATRERVVEFTPRARRALEKSFRSEPVFENREALDQGTPPAPRDLSSSPAKEAPGVAGPFV